ITFSFNLYLRLEEDICICPLEETLSILFVYVVLVFATAGNSTLSLEIYAIRSLFFWSVFLLTSKCSPAYLPYPPTNILIELPPLSDGLFGIIIEACLTLSYSPSSK